MSLKGVIQGLDENGEPKPAVLSQAAAAAVERMIPLLSEFPYLLQNGLALLNKYGHYPALVQSPRTSPFAISRR